MLIDEILGSYRQGEGLSAEDTAVLAEQIIKAHRDRTSLCTGINATQRELKSYFLRLRDVSLYEAFRSLDGVDVERYQAMADRIEWRLQAGLPGVKDELDSAINFALTNNLPIPTSTTRLREIIIATEMAQEELEEWVC